MAAKINAQSHASVSPYIAHVLLRYSDCQCKRCVGLRGATATLRAGRRLRKHAVVFRLPTLSAVTRVESVLLRPGPHADAKQPGQDDKREEHGRESQSDLL